MKTSRLVLAVGADLLGLMMELQLSSQLPLVQP
jgi:hypothetical protein